MQTLRRLVPFLVVLSLIISTAACASPTPTDEPATEEPAAEEPVVEEAATEEPAAEEPTEEEPASDESAPEEVIELRVAWWGSQNRHDRTVQAIKLFEEQHPNIKVTYEFAGWDDYWPLVKTEAGGGNLPDVMQMDYEYVAEWVGNGLLKPLDDYVATGVLDVTDVAEDGLSWFIEDGKLYGVPLGISPEAWVLDLDAFEKAGVEVPQQDWAWDDFEETAQEIHDKLGIWGNNIQISHIQNWESMLLGYGESVYGLDGKSLDFTDEPVIEFFNMILRLQDAGAIPTREEEVEYLTSDASPFVQGEAAMTWIGGSNLLIGLWETAGLDRNLKLTHIPRPEGGQPSVYIRPSMSFSVSAHSQHPEEAAMFVDWFIHSVEANEILMAERGVPVSKAVRDGLKAQLERAQLEVFEYIDRVEADGSPRPNPSPPGHGDIRANVYYPELVDPVLYGLLTPEEALENFRVAATAVLEAENE